MEGGNISYFESEQVDTSAFMTPEKLQQGVASILEEVMPSYDILWNADDNDQVRGCPPAPGHREVLVPGQWEVKEAEKRRREVPLVMIIVHLCGDYCVSLWWSYGNGHLRQTAHLLYRSSTNNNV